MKRCLITGVAGFIGFHLAKEMLEQGYEIVGVDDLNDYYDPKIKYSRLKILEEYKNFKFYIANIADQVTMGHIFNEYEFDAVCNLAAYAGVRYSLIKPFYYIQSNIVGFQVILEMVRDHEIKNLVFASSASVYGSNEKQPFSEDDPVDNPMAIYAVTKRQNELAAKSYNHLFGLNCTGLRYFTAYGPYGRPDLALFKFTKNILEDKPIDIYNHGMMERTFTFIDDVVRGTITAIERPMGYEIFNIGGEENIDLIQYVDMIEDCLGKKAIRNYMELQPGDITAARCDISKAKKLLDYNPRTPIDLGIEMFINWYRDFYGV